MNDPNNMHIKFNIPTLVVASHIGLMYMVIEGNYDLTTSECIKYYLGLASIVYATEFCCLARNSVGYTIERQFNDTYILVPLFGVPIMLTSMYVIGFSVYNMISRARIITAILGFGGCYLYHRNFTFIIPLVITYIPFITVMCHILIIFGTILLVRYNKGMYNEIIERNLPTVSRLYTLFNN